MEKIKFEDEDFILNFKPFEELKEAYSEEDILTDETVESLMKELEDLQAERKEVRALPSEEDTKQEKYNRLKEIDERVREINSILYRHKVSKAYFTSPDTPATEDDWEELLDRLPNEFEFDDLEVEVETEDDEEPVGWNYQTDSIIYQTYPAQHGYITRWYMTIDPTEELVCKFLGKQKDQILTRDLKAIDEDDYYEFIIDDEDCIEKASEDALENYTYEDVHWDEDYYEPDYD